MDSEFNVKCVMTLKGKTHFLIYTGTEHRIAENLEELRQSVDEWATKQIEQSSAVAKK